jgi:hypothetical protein
MSETRFKISRAELERIKEAARALPKQPKQQLSRQEAIEELEETLVHMERELELPLSAILQFLADQGLPMSASTLQGYRRKTAEQKTVDPRAKAAKRTRQKLAISAPPGEQLAQPQSEAAQVADEAASELDTIEVAASDPVPSLNVAPTFDEPTVELEQSVPPVVKPDGTPDMPLDKADAQFLNSSGPIFEKLEAMSRELWTDA